MGSDALCLVNWPRSHNTFSLHCIGWRRVGAVNRGIHQELKNSLWFNDKTLQFPPMTGRRRRRWCIYSPLSPPLIDMHWSVESSSCAPPGYLTISQPKWCGFWEGTREGNYILYSFITTNITVTTTQLNPSGQLTLLGFWYVLYLCP